MYEIKDLDFKTFDKDRIELDIANQKLSLFILPDEKNDAHSLVLINKTQNLIYKEIGIKNNSIKNFLNTEKFPGYGEIFKNFFKMKEAKIKLEITRSFWFINCILQFKIEEEEDDRRLEYNLQAQVRELR